VALVTRGDRGCGKSVLVEELIGVMVGSNQFVVAKAARILSTFNKAASKQMLINLDEMSSKDGIQFAENLKTLITSESIQIEPKGIDAYSESNYARIWATTNNANVVQPTAGEESRRIVAFRASNKHCKDVEYFSQLRVNIKLPEVQWSLYHYLKQRDITDVKFERDRPSTQEYDHMVNETVPQHVHFMYYLSCVEEDWSAVVSGIQAMPEEVFMETDSLFTLHCSFVTNCFGEPKTPWNKIYFSKLIKSLADDVTPGVGENRLTSGMTQVRTKYKRGYSINLRKLKAFLIRRFGVTDEAVYLSSLTMFGVNTTTTPPTMYQL
jgi:Family of unknown function (DUF5906)